MLENIFKRMILNRAWKFSQNYRQEYKMPFMAVHMSWEKTAIQTLEIPALEN